MMPYACQGDAPRNDMLMSYMPCTWVLDCNWVRTVKLAFQSVFTLAEVGHMQNSTIAG